MPEDASIGKSKTTTLLEELQKEADKLTAAQAKYLAAVAKSERENREEELKLNQQLRDAIRANNAEVIAATIAAQEELAKKRKSQERELAREYAKELLKSESKEERKKGKKELKEITKQEAKEAWDESGGFKGKIAKTFEEFNKQRAQGLGQTIKETATDNLIKTMKAVGKAISDGLNQVNQAISKYAQYQTAINTRLQGAVTVFKDENVPKTFNTIAKTLKSVAFSPLVKAENLYANVNKLVEEGVAFNVEQRAFLMTVKDGIATTFDADNQALRRLIRIQQQDSTAARLGMESYLTQFLNEFVNSTEYLTSTFDNVADHLLEASAMLMDSDASAEFEYIVQKWLGTLTGIGLSDSTATAIAQAIGQIGSGDISNLGAGGIQSLMVLAAARSGLDYAKLLSSGLDAVDVNTLMKSMVYYIQEIGKSSSNVVKSQLAKTFGLSVSDLVAIGKNLEDKDIEAVFNSMMSYANMESELVKEMGSLGSRIGIANILENLASNITFQTGMNIASTPATYAMWKIADIIEGTTGGINIPFITALGTGIGLETTATNLMKLGIMGVSFLGNIGNIVKGISAIGNGNTLLEALNIGAGRGLEIQKRGQGLSTYTVDNSGVRKITSGTTTSTSTYIGNVEGSAYSENAVEEAKKEANAELENTENDPTKSVLAYLSKEVQLATRLEAIEKYLKNMDDGITIRTVSSAPAGWTTEGVS